MPATDCAMPDLEPAKDFRVADLVTLDEVVQITNLRLRTLTNYIYTNKLPSLRVGRARLFHKPTILQWNERRLTKQAELTRLRASAMDNAGLNRNSPTNRRESAMKTSAKDVQLDRAAERAAIEKNFALGESFFTKYGT